MIHVSTENAVSVTGSGFRNIMHYACIILSKKMKFKYQLIHTDSENMTDSLISKELKQK